MSESGTRRCREALAEVGVTVSCLRPAPSQMRGQASFVGRVDSAGVRIVVRNRRDALLRAVARLWAVLARRDVPEVLPLSLAAQVNREAATERLAHERGIAVPAIVFAGVVRGLALLVELAPAGPDLAAAGSAGLDDAALDTLWGQVRALHEAGIVHGMLDAHHVLMTGGYPLLVGFESSSTSGGESGARRDVAELVTATAAIVGPERAVGAATRALGAVAVAAAVGRVPPEALSGRTHDAVGGHQALDEHLRRLRASATRDLNVELAEPDRLYRISPRALVMAVATFVALATLLSRIGSPSAFWESMQSAEWAFVALAFALGMLRDVVYGITFLGNVPVRIPIWPSIELQVAMAFSNLAVPVAADSAIQVRFLHRNGLDIPTAVATGGVLSSMTEIAVQLALFFLAIRLAPDSLDFGAIDVAKIEVVLAGVLALVAVVSAVVLGVRRVRLLVLPPIRRALRTAWHALRSPSRLALLIGGNVVAQLLTAASLLACVRAFGISVDFWTLMAISIGVGLVASIVPVPGGGIAVSAIGLAGMLTAVGVPQSASAAAVITYHLVHSYLPAIPGWFATHDLLRKHLL